MLGYDREDMLENRERDYKKQYEIVCCLESKLYSPFISSLLSFYHHIISFWILIMGLSIKFYNFCGVLILSFSFYKLSYYGIIRIYVQWCYNYGFIFVISFNSGIFHNGNPVVYNYQSIISNFLGLIICNFINRILVNYYNHWNAKKR